MSGKILGPVGVTEATGGFIASEAITNAKLAKPAAAPVFGGGKGQQVPASPTPTPARTVVLALNISETTKKYKLTHNLGQQLPIVFAVKASTFEVTPLTIVKSESASKTEIEIQSAVVDKEEFYLTFIG